MNGDDMYGETAVQRIIRLKEELVAMHEQRRTKDAEIARLRDANTALLKANSEISLTVQEQKGEIARLTRELEEAKNKILLLEQDSYRYCQDRDTLREKLRDAEVEIADAKREHERLRLLADMLGDSERLSTYQKAGDWVLAQRPEQLKIGLPVRMLDGLSELQSELRKLEKP